MLRAFSESPTVHFRPDGRAGAGGAGMVAAAPRAPRGQWPPHWTAPSPGAAARVTWEALQAPGRRHGSESPGAPRRQAPAQLLEAPGEPNGGRAGRRGERTGPGFPPRLAPRWGPGRGWAPRPRGKRAPSAPTPRALAPRCPGTARRTRPRLGPRPAACPSAPASDRAPSRPARPPRRAPPHLGQGSSRARTGRSGRDERRGGRGRHPNLTRRPLP